MCNAVMHNFLGNAFLLMLREENHFLEPFPRQRAYNLRGFSQPFLLVANPLFVLRRMLCSKLLSRRAALWMNVPSK